MGTRSNTVVIETGHEKEQILLNLYRQMDGYPSGQGKDLCDFLSTISMVNGIGLSNTRKVANGAGCLAAQLVAHFKEGAGDFYIASPTKGAAIGQNDYSYVIRINTYEPKAVWDIQVYEGGYKAFRGGLGGFEAFCKEGVDA